jgi:cell division protein FtsW
MNYKRYKTAKVIKFIIGISILLLGIVALGTALKIDSLVPLINGSRRWINLKIIRLQPSELLKIAYIILLAKGLHGCKKNNYKNKEVISTVAPLIFLFVMMVFLQRDLGTALHYIAISIVMLFFSEIDLKYIFGVVTVVLIIGVGYISYAYTLGDDTSYRNRRIKAYINGVIYDEYDNSDGYQIKQSLIAIGNGGISGKGLGNGTQKYSYLPEIHTDFILASVGEEWGFVGVSIMFLAYIIILQIGVVIAKSTEENFGRYLAIGIVGYLFTQIIMNVYVVTGLMPVTGIPLPLMSYGGTSLWTTLFSIGILYNINRYSLNVGGKDVSQEEKSAG